jgi:hypothetical protein
VGRNIPIIYYHSIAPKRHPSWFKNYLTLELKFFEVHLKYFTENNYHFINLHDYFEAVEKDYSNKKYVCLTFDDGYLDNYIYVYPLLKKHKTKATIFVNPVFVDKRQIIRQSLEEYWNNKTSLEEIEQWGFLSWDEMRLMENSGLVDIQSHTLTHTKNFVSDKLVGFHHPRADCLYYIGNQYPERLPYYIQDEQFEKLIPYGFPIFEQKSSVVAYKVDINPSFNQSIIQSFDNFDWTQPYDFKKMFNQIKHFYDESKEKDSIIIQKESADEFKKRVIFELSESKRIIENELTKRVDFCCWPHGDNDEFAHHTAMQAGYKATTTGKNLCENISNSERISPRIGLSSSKDSLLLTRLKTHYKVKCCEKAFPYLQLNNVYQKLRYFR